MEHYHTGELLSLKEALNIIFTLTTPMAEKEIIPLTESINRITATEIISPINVPPFDNSAMDGYAIRFNDWHDATPLVIAGKALAGSPFREPLPAKSCIRIMTGAPIPIDVDTVIMQENTLLANNAISFTQPIKPGTNIRFTGEDIRQGDSVLPIGTKLSATQVSLIASLGISEIEVFRQLKVAIFSTGDELQTIGQPLAAGQIYDTNRLAIRLMLEKMNCQLIDLGIIADDPDKLYQAFKQADQQADLVISSGGVSVGEADYTKQILDEIGSINFWQLAIKPGKPFAFGKLKSAWFCGLPGNTVSAIVTFYQLVQPIINHLCAFTQWQSTPYLKARATSLIKTSPGRLEFQRGIAKVNTQGDLEVTPMAQQGSHILSSFNQSNCFIVLAQNRGQVNAGELVDIEYFNYLLISMAIELSDQEILRYNRQIILQNFDFDGQEKLKAAKVLIVGVGGLGCAAAQYLAAAGVGQLTLLDFDTISLSNLPRQILYNDQSIGSAKVDSAKTTLLNINPYIKISTIDKKLTEHELNILIKQQNVIVDCTDNVAIREQLNRLCLTLKRPLVSGAAIRMEGQLVVLTYQDNTPCYHCLSRLFGENNLSCIETGVMSPLVGIIGSLQAMETLKLLTNYGQINSGKVLFYDAMLTEFRTINLMPDPNCEICQPSQK